VNESAPGTEAGAAAGTAAGGAPATTAADPPGGAPAPAAAPPSAPAPDRAGGRAFLRVALGRALGRALGGLLGNLRAALILYLRPPPAGELPSGLAPSVAQLVLLYALGVLLGVAGDAYVVGGGDGRLDISSLPAVSFWALVTLFAAGGAAALQGCRERTLALATAGFALACWQFLAIDALAVAADRVPSFERYALALAWVPVVWSALAFAFFALRLAAGRSRRRRAAVAVLALALLLSPQWLVDPAERLWIAAASADAPDGGPESAQSEHTLYQQIDLLDEALDAVEAGQPGVTELFTISFAGDGSQDVFINEANGADAVMAEAFGSADHSIVLANSSAHPQERPFASVSALQRALGTMADRMNADEDVLAIFLTSHGTPDHHLSVSMPPYVFDDLTPERLRALLDESGIRYRVVIVSACYSGGFIDALAGDDTLVITASQADRSSFGCRDGARWTDFGQAFFSEALTQTASFEGAFRLASQRIDAREKKEGLTPSLPQISVGAGIREQLRRLETRRGGRILFARAAAAAAGHSTGVAAWQ
jgi:hypothetical protein